MKVIEVNRNIERTGKHRSYETEKEKGEGEEKYLETKK